MEIQIEKLCMDGGTQPRAELSGETVKDYAMAMQNGVKFPPVIVFHDGTTHWLVDGYHRTEAARLTGKVTVTAEVKQGDHRAAILYSVSANSENQSLRRTNADKRRAVEILLNDEEWGKWSNREIARRCAVDEKTVRSLREIRSEEPTYTTKHGTEAKMNTSKIGRKKRTTFPEPMPAVAKKIEAHPDLPPMIAVTLPEKAPKKAAAILYNHFKENYLKTLFEELMILFERDKNVK